ncbi:vanin-like protein 2 [Drosophila innubila]|uniref:vanin-like protein 2 n=1 Tax=Drosophila innubila TaxID=198719 RepID=UPI00148E1B08|nr:vanin-like protein 2 [Drosophila innubila]
MATLTSTWSGQQLSWMLLILTGIALTQQAAIDKANFYTAGVVEFRRANDDDWRNNYDGYVEIINSENAKATDIIVFPEATLNGLNSTSFVPDPEKNINPCLEDAEFNYYAEFLVKLSCAARNVSKYIVINLSERQLCSDTPEDTRPCAPNGFNVFNTNVVFDRNGTVVSRYRKVNLYDEPRNTTFIPESISFETDFNVTFGHIICFDILFYKPGHELIMDKGIRNFVYPSMWFSQLPFLTAVQTQLGWAYGNNVNLLAAGASRPEVGSTGTGIFRGRDGTIVSTMQAGEGERRLYVAQVPKYDESSKISSKSIGKPLKKTQKTVNSQELKMKRDNLELYETVSLDMLMDQAEDSSLNKEVCHGQICCQFELEWNLIGQEPIANNSYYNYRLAAYDGWRDEKYGNLNYVRNCGIFACNGPNLADCGKLVDKLQPRVAFKRLIIEATYPKSKEFLFMPNSVLDNLLPLEPNQFEWSIEELKDENEQKVRFALAKSLELQNLLTFAIYGNYYDDQCTFGKGTPEQDRECGWKPKGDGASGLRFSSFFLLTLSLTLTILFKQH